MLPQAVRGWRYPLYTQSLAAVPDGPAKTAIAAEGGGTATLPTRSTNPFDVSLRTVR